MKKLEDFQAKKIDLKNVWGGGEVATKTVQPSSPGSACLDITSDTFSDNNGNGKQDAGEPGISCTIRSC